MVKKAKKTPAKPAQQIKVPFGGWLAGLLKIRERWYEKNAGTASAPGWVRSRLQRRDRSSTAYSFAHLAGPGIPKRSRPAVRGAARRFMIERQWRAGYVEALDQWNNVCDRLEAKGHEMTVIDLFESGVSEEAISRFLSKMNPRERRAGNASWLQRKPVSLHTEVFARAAESTRPKAPLASPAPAGDPETKAAGDEAADSGASPLPP